MSTYYIKSVTVGFPSFPRSSLGFPKKSAGWFKTNSQFVGGKHNGYFWEVFRVFFR